MTVQYSRTSNIIPRPPSPSDGRKIITLFRNNTNAGRSDSDRPKCLAWSKRTHLEFGLVHLANGHFGSVELGGPLARPFKPASAIALSLGRRILRLLIPRW